MKILLVKPSWFVPGGVYRFLDRVRFAPLNLGILAALSQGHDVRIVDNDREPVPYGEQFDLVGITATTFTSHKAFEIADRFRPSGARIVIGGVHACLMPDECLEHADAVVIGEAEYVWPQILTDARNSALKRRYVQSRPTDMDDVPAPRRDLLKEDPLFAAVQATRGCNNRCNFCYLPNVPWHQFRKRDPQLVYEEIKSIPQKIIYFVDDSLFSDTDYAIRLCEKIAPLKKAWSVQAPTTIARDPRLISAMRRSGCFFVQIGFQTVNPDSLDAAGVTHNRIADYRSTVQLLHKNGILVQGFFIFGFDTDDERIFSTTESAIRRMGIEDALLYILTPYPGTKVYDDLAKQGRLLTADRSRYGWASAVFKPAKMTAAELEAGVQRTYENLFRFFRSRAPLQMIRWAPFFLRHPRLLRLAWRALNRKIVISPVQ